MSTFDAPRFERSDVLSGKNVRAGTGCRAASPNIFCDARPPVERPALSLANPVQAIR